MISTVLLLSILGMGCQEQQIDKETPQKTNALYQADLFYYGYEKTPQDHQKAASLYKKACEEQSVRGCLEWAHKLHYGFGTPRSSMEAKQIITASLIEKAVQQCSKEDPQTCLRLGSIYMLGLGVEKSTKKGAKWYQKACDAEQAQACYNLAFLYQKGEGVRKKPSEAVSLLKKACNADLMISCASLATLYDSTFKGNERVVPIDDKRAAALYQKSCDGGAMTGCFNLGAMYEFGKIGKTDTEKAASLYKKACDGEYMRACQKLENVHKSKD